MTTHMLLRFGSAVLLLASCGGAADDLVEASGTVEATEAGLGFRMAGRVDSMLVREGDRVQAGDRLAVMDRRELEARLDAASAQLAAQRARLTELERGFRPEELVQGRAAERAAARRLADQERDLTRARNLFGGGAISRQSLDAAETAHQLAAAEHERVAAQLRLLETGPRQEQIAAQRAQVAGARAQLAQAEAALDFATVTAPFAGIVTRRHHEPGEVVAAGQPVFTVIDPEDRWVRIYIREDQVGRAAIGQAASLRIDAWPDREYRGDVVFISDEAEFTPRNIQTREERVKLVYRLRIRVVGDTALDLKPGIIADVVLAERP